MTCHELTGLEADNLLAFLALLGLLRALEAARENWRPQTLESFHPTGVKRCELVVDIC